MQEVVARSANSKLSRVMRGVMAKLQVSSRPDKTFSASVDGIPQDIVSKWLMRICFIAVTALTSYNGIALKQTLEKAPEWNAQSLVKVLKDPEVRAVLSDIMTRQPLENEVDDQDTVKPPKHNRTAKRKPVPRRSSRFDLDGQLSVPGKSVQPIPTSIRQ